MCVSRGSACVFVCVEAKRTDEGGGKNERAHCGRQRGLYPLKQPEQHCRSCSTQFLILSRQPAVHTPPTALWATRAVLLIDHGAESEDFIELETYGFILSLKVNILFDFSVLQRGLSAV